MRSFDPAEPETHEPPPFLTDEKGRERFKRFVESTLRFTAAKREGYDTNDCHRISGGLPPLCPTPAAVEVAV